MAAHVVLPWTHRVFANLKRWALGVYHGLRRKHLQSYLDEFAFRFNRRHTRHAALPSAPCSASPSPKCPPPTTC
jgi:ISXO2-like transposase domain